MPGLPDFIPQTPPLGDPQSPPPYLFDGVEVQSYSVLAEASKLTALCDRFLNKVAADNGANFRILPITGFGKGLVNVQLLHYPKMYSATPGFENLGFTFQNELLVSIPVVRTTSLGLPVAVGIFVPYLWVDNAWSLITGRDVVGFPKSDGQFTMPQNIWDTDGCEVAALASDTTTGGAIGQQIIFKTRKTAATPFVRAQQANMAARHVPGKPFGLLAPDMARPLWPFGPVDLLFNSGELVAAESGIRDMLHASAGLGARCYALKQLRDPEDPYKACYQAIVEGHTAIRRFHQGGLLPETELEIPGFLTPDIIAQLGIVANGDKVSPVFGFWSNSDLALRDLKNLVERCGTGGSARPAASPCFDILRASVCGTLMFYKGMAEAWLDVMDDCIRPDRGKN